MENTSVEKKKSLKNYKQNPWLLIICVTLVVATSAFSIGLMLGRQGSIRAAVPEGEGIVLNQGDISEKLSEDVDFRQFWAVWNLVKETYHQQPVSDLDLYYGAVHGVLEALDDPYSTFFDPSEAEAFESALQGSFEGIGAEIGLRDDQLQIIAPLPGTPAEKAGLKTGDVILKIDDLDTEGMTVEEAVTHIRGEGGTEVVLKVARQDIPDSIDIHIVRDVIVIESVRYAISEDKVATISIFTFNQDTDRLFDAAVKELLDKDIKKIVLDMRGNPGGLLTSAIHVSSAWVGNQPVVLEKTQAGQKSLTGFGNAPLKDIPTVVLVNGGSASGSEIVAGALQDYKSAQIIGTQTFGKGSVQDYRDLPDGSAVKITIAEWLTPLGRSINKEGITPDVVVEVSLENLEEDVQMNKALELLK